MEYRTLGKTGLKVSRLSFGAAPLGNVYGQVNTSEAVRAVHTALDFGLNFIDVAPFYGLTLAETVLGQALKGISRERYYLATKVGRYGESEYDFSAERVTASVHESLARLGLDYIDLIQCHDIEAVSLEQIINETIPALRRLQEQGKVRFVGITGFPLKIFSYVAERIEIDTILCYCRYQLNNTTLATIIPYLHTKNLGIINASPLGMGLLTSRGAFDWHPATAEVKQACARAAAYCQQQGIEIAQLALQFSLAQPDISTTLVGMASSAIVEQNIKWLETPLDPAFLAEVQAILAPIQNQIWLSGRPENN